MEPKGNLAKHHKNSEIDSFETWHTKKTTQIGLWSHCRCYVGQYILMLSLFWPFSYSLMQIPPSILKLPTQHLPYFFKHSIQHQPAITRIENWAFLPTQGLQFSYTLIRAFSKKYLRTPKQYSSTQQRILAWTNSSRRARRHAWCWVELYPHHCLRGECWNQSLFTPLWATRTNGWHVILLYI